MLAFSIGADMKAIVILIGVALFVSIFAFTKNVVGGDSIVMRLFTPLCIICTLAGIFNLIAARDVITFLIIFIDAFLLWRIGGDYKYVTASID